MRKTTKDEACRHRRSADNGATMQTASLSSMPGHGAGVSFCRAQAPTQARKHEKHEKHSIRAWASRQVAITSWRRLQPPSLQAGRRHGKEHARGACPLCVCVACFYLAQSFYRYKKLRVRLCVPVVGCGTLTG